MINLLPVNALNDITYARRNTHIRHWIFIVLIGLAGVVVIVGAGVFIINRSTAQVSKQAVVAQEQLDSQKIDEVQDRVDDISTSIKLATQVLSRQIVLSKLIQQIATVLPNGTVLSGLQLNTVDGDMNLSIIAVDFQAATQVQVNLKDPDNKLFNQADINNIACNGIDPRYPCTASFKVLFADKNAYSFLGEGTNP